MNKREFKDRVYHELAAITKAMANPHRLEIIELLAQGDFSVEQIASHTQLTVANASQHLQVLKTAQLVDVSRKGTFIYYRLANQNVFAAWKALRDLGMERIAAVEKLVRNFRSAHSHVRALTIEELLPKLDAGEVTLLDVRPEAEFNKGHLAKALSIPIGELDQRLNELPRHSEIVAYCRGPFCVFADEAVATLSGAGFKAFRLEEGFPDWQLQGLPVEISNN